MQNLIMLILGVIISFLGITNIKGNISTIHSYNRRKVMENNIPKYGKAVGTGTLIIGVSFIVGFVLLALKLDNVLPFVILPACIIGLAFMLYAQFKYNGGIF